MPDLIQTGLIRATSGPLAGHVVCPVDWDKFADFKGRCYAAHVAYGWGSKDPGCGSGRVGFTRIDCSGFARTLLMYAAGGPDGGAMRLMPDGSYTQGDWLAAQGFKPTAPENSALADGHLRCCVHHPDGMDEAGHIWLACNSHTIESFGGHGPGQRAWNAPLHSGHTLNELASVCFVLC